MKEYLDLMRDVLENGIQKGDRTGTGTKSVFGRQVRFDLTKGFPIVTTKAVSFKNIAVELDWFLQGDTNIKYLVDNGCNIWNEWALAQEHVEKYTNILLDYKDLMCEVNNLNKDEEFFKLLEERGSIEMEAIAKELNINVYKKYSEFCNVGDLGPVYGKQWRSWQLPDGNTLDQIEELINLIKTKPNSRRLIISAWNPADLPDETISPQQNVLHGQMALAPCHTMFQFYTRDMSSHEKLDYLYDNNRDAYKLIVSNYDEEDFYTAKHYDDVEKYFTENNLPKKYLSCQLYQRSADLFLGVPYNIASYALLTEIIAKVTNTVAHEFIHTFGDLHLYSNHLKDDIVYEQLRREPHALPKLVFLKDIKDINEFRFSDVKLENYTHEKAIRAPIAV